MKTEAAIAPVPSATHALVRESSPKFAVVANLGVTTVGLVTGATRSDYVQLFALKVLHQPADRIGLLLSLLPFATMVQLTVVGIAKRRGCRAVMRRGYLLLALCLCPIFLVPAVASRSLLGAFVIFGGVMLVAECLQACSWGTAWMPWIRSLVPEARRARFLGRMRLATNVFFLVVTALFALLIRTGMSAGKFELLVGGVVVYLLLSVVVMDRIDDPTVSAPDRVGWQVPAVRGASGAGVAAVVKTAVRQRRIRIVYLLQLGAGFTAAPLVTVYAIERLRLSAGFVGLLVTVLSLATVAGLFALGPMIDRIGFRRVLFWLNIVLVPICLAWLFVPTTTSGTTTREACLLILAVSLQLVGTGLNLSTLTALHSMTKSDDAVEVFAVADTWSTVVLTAPPLVAGFAISASGHLTSLGPLHVDPYRVFIGIGAIAGCGLAFLVRRSSRIGASADAA